MTKFAKFVIKKGMDISGVWEYSEDFEFGTSVGEVEITQHGNEVSAVFRFTEEVKNDYKIEVVEKTQGTIAENKVLLKSIEVRATENDREISYLPNNFEVFLVAENKLVGSTYDSEDVCGVFVLERIM